MSERERAVIEAAKRWAEREPYWLFAANTWDLDLLDAVHNLINPQPEDR